MRVLMVIQRFRPYFSGQGIQLEQLSRKLLRRGVDVVIVTAVRGRDAPYEEISDRVSIRRLRSDLVGGFESRFGRRLWSPTFALRTLLHLLSRRDSFDLVHVHGVNDGMYAAWLVGRLRRVPVVLEMTLLGVDDPASVRAATSAFRKLRNAVYERFSAYVAMSPALESAYLAAGLPAERMRMIPQGVDVERFRPAADRPALRREIGAADGEAVFVFVGSLVERKGIDVLLAAWAEIHRARPDAWLWLVGRDRFGGDRSAEASLERWLSAIPAEAAARVRRFGVRDDPERFLQAADVLLFPSRREGFGSAIIEAMACGRPCVVAELPGISDFIFAGEAEGIVVPQADPAALARAAVELAADADRMATIGSRARLRARERFSIERVADEYLGWYEEIRRRGGGER